jgi:hypothetical protein
MNRFPTGIRITIMTLRCCPKGRIGTEAPSDKELLIQVLRHKETFYPSARARYDLARPGSFRLVPGENRVPVLETDYRNKAVMTFSRRLYSIGL